MSRMIDLVRKSAISSNMMYAAARGALTVPPGEMIEILVHLANHNKIFGQQARMTLAGWDEKASRQAAGDPATPHEVLEYMSSPQNLRMQVLPALLENPSVTEDLLMPLASSGSREVVDAFKRSARASAMTEIMQALRANPNFGEPHASAIPDQGAVVPAAPEASEAADDHPAPSDDRGPAQEVEAETDGPAVGDDVVESFLSEHAGELASHEEKAFQPIGGVYEEAETEGEGAPDSVPGEASTAQPPVEAPKPTTQPKPAVPARPAPGKAAHAHKKAQPGEAEKRDSTLQKIAKLDIKGRIQLAMKGTKEERSLLVRDGTKLVALAVLESPKISDGEVEKIASQKNVLEAVLRSIPMKRRYAKQYTIMRNLVFNPRTPMDVALGLMKNLMINDLKNLSGNKEVPDTIRKLALRMFKQKVDAAGKK